MRVIICEDDGLTQLRLARTLGRLGFQVLATVGDGVSAVAVTRALAPDIVLMDVNMPGLDGVEAARQIMRFRPTPVVMLTSYGSDEIVRRAQEAGACGYLLKPVRDEQLAPALALAAQQFAERQAAVDRLVRLETELDAARAAIQHAETLARRDELTGLLNRRGLIEALDQELLRSPCLSIALFDLDDFKALNDQLGHDAGDRVLRAVGEIVRDNIREGDAAGRLGGDEFVIVLAAPEAGARAVVTRLHAALTEEARAQGWPTSFSLGSVTFTALPPSSDEALTHADQVMYRVKRSRPGTSEHRTIGPR